MKHKIVGWNKKFGRNVISTIFAVFVVMLFLGNTVVSEISLSGAVNIASEYAGDREIAAGPLNIYKNNHLYYSVDFYKGTTYTGLIVIDGVTGNIVRDKSIATDVLFAKYLYENCSTSEVQTFYKISYAFDVYAVRFKEQAQKDLNMSATVAPELSEDFKNLSAAEFTLSDSFSDLSVSFGELSVIEWNILQEPSYEYAAGFFDKCDETVTHLEAVADGLLDVRLILIGIYAKVEDPDNKQNVETYLNYVTAAEESTTLKAEQLEVKFDSKKSAVDADVENALVYTETRHKKEVGIPVNLLLMIVIPAALVGCIGFFYGRRKKYRYVRKRRRR